ncbi:MAG: hypothetical protein GF331_15565, partial [Chitinivibrionales bacterium]|nr:hypothetical protein [Chitinivibrionales bacterium]
MRVSTVCVWMNLCAAGAAGGIVYVNQSANGDGSGVSWADAMTDLSAALAAAGAGDTVCVSAGVYRPHASLRGASFELADSVVVVGGFVGDETSIDQQTVDGRDFDVHTTVLSGDLNDDDTTGGDSTENSYHVLTGSGLSAATVLDGFTIFGGNANGSSSNGTGAGLRCMSCSLTVRNAIFYRNSALSNGGGLHTTYGDITLESVTFRDNRVAGGTNPQGGGIFSIASVLRVSDGTFVGNRAYWGGGLYSVNEASAAFFRRAVFERNVASYGAGIA